MDETTAVRQTPVFRGVDGEVMQTLRPVLEHEIDLAVALNQVLDLTKQAAAVGVSEEAYQQQVQMTRTARVDLERFKDQVRDKAIEVAEEQSWCDEGLNSVLSELGLEPKSQEYEVRIGLTACHTVTAGSDEDAADMVKSDLESSERYFDGYFDIVDVDVDVA